MQHGLVGEGDGESDEEDVGEDRENGVEGE